MSSRSGSAIPQRSASLRVASITNGSAATESVVTAAIGGDNLQDLKCGQLVGSTPWKQQVMQILGVVVAAFAMAPVLNLLNDAYHIGSKALPAPQKGRGTEQ